MKKVLYAILPDRKLIACETDAIRYLDGRYDLVEISTGKSFNPMLSVLVTLESIKEMRARLLKLIENKDLIVEYAKHYKADENVSKYVYDERLLLNTKSFNLSEGICQAVRMTTLIDTNILRVWATEFKGNNWIYPVGSSGEYAKSHDSRTMWLNNDRWEYANYLITKLDEAAEILK